MSEALPAIPPPPWWLLIAELRAIPERVRFLLAAPTDLPRGDGHGVLVIPGFGASDRHMAPLRRALGRLGYDVRGWGAGRNLGMSLRAREAMNAALDDLYARHGPVSVIGWSLGGVFARELARRRPTDVRRVFTLGSPITGTPYANRLLGISLGFSKPEPEGSFRRRVPPPPVPCVAIWTVTDGIVASPCTREAEGPLTENVEVKGSHFGLAANVEVLRVLAERLGA